jgi:hypothetical protein
MRTKILFSLIVVISTCGSITAQTLDSGTSSPLPTEAAPQNADAVLKEVTLYWYHPSGRYFPRNQMTADRP